MKCKIYSLDRYRPANRERLRAARREALLKLPRDVREAVKFSRTLAREERQAARAERKALREAKLAARTAKLKAKEARREALEAMPKDAQKRLTAAWRCDRAFAATPTPADRLMH